MDTVVAPEYLGDIDPELLLQNLTNVNPYINSIDELRFGLQKLREKGVHFSVTAEFETETVDEAEAFRRFGTPQRFASMDETRAAIRALQGQKRFVRLVIEPSR